MNVTSRSRYALKIMIDMAQHNDENLVKRHDIVQRQGIPDKYLDQIMIRLRKAGLVQSIRGRTGGYRMGRPTADISVWEIFRAVEDGLYPVLCLDEQHQLCDFDSVCLAREPWQIIFAAVQKPLQNLRLADILRQMPSAKRDVVAHGVHECCSGRVTDAKAAPKAEVH